MQDCVEKLLLMKGNRNSGKSIYLDYGRVSENGNINVKDESGVSV